MSARPALPCPPPPAGRAWLPRPNRLDATAWRQRHAVVVSVLAGAVPLLALIALVAGRPPVHVALAVTPPALLTLAAACPAAERRLRTMMAAGGLLACSLAAVDLSGGLVEAHVTLFVAVALIGLYGEWLPLLLAAAVLLGEHLVVPHASTGGYGAWRWAVLHAGVLLAAGAVSVTGWALAEAEARRFAEVVARARDEQLAELTQRVLHDALTGLPNRVLVLDRLRHALAVSARSGRGVGVLFLDLDGFKAVNDTHGHAVGDALLVAVARRLSGSVRSGDTPGRLSGDEFVVVCEDLDGPDGLERARARVEAALGTPCEVAGVPHRVGVSVGAAFADRPYPGERAAQELLERADARMYDRKRARREISLTAGTDTLVLF